MGAPLHEEMAGRPINPRRAVELCIQIADALADGHAAGVLHGDLRPETIGVTAKGSAKLLDFGMWRWTRGGLVRRAAARAPESLPDEDSVIASYMAPEQALGGETDGRADLFSLGTILHEMLTGHNPFKAPSVAATVMNVVTVTPPRPSAITSGIPAELDEIAVRALAKTVEGRFQSAASFSAQLRSVAAALDVRPDDKGGEFLLPVDDEADRTPTAVWVAGGAGVAAVGAVVWWILSRRACRRGPGRNRRAVACRHRGRGERRRASRAPRPPGQGRGPGRGGRSQPPGAPRRGQAAQRAPAPHRVA